MPYRHFQKEKAILALGNDPHMKDLAPSACNLLFYASVTPCAGNGS